MISIIITPNINRHNETPLLKQLTWSILLTAIPISQYAILYNKIM